MDKEISPELPQVVRGRHFEIHRAGDGFEIWLRGRKTGHIHSFPGEAEYMARELEAESREGSGDA